MRVAAAKGSMPIASAKLAPGTKTKTKVRTIKPAGKGAFKYAFAKKQGQAEKVRVVVTFGKGKTARVKTVVCAVKIGSPAATLNVSFDGDGIGTITSAPGGTACATEKSPCAEDYKSGAKVTLKADADATSTFTGWGGSCSGTATSCTVTVTGIKNVTASFARKTFTVTIEKAGDGDGTVTSDGALNCGTTCTATVAAGTIVRLKAAPDANSRLVGWTGECTSTVNQCNFPVDGDIDVTVTFAKQGSRLNVSRAGDGTGTISADVPGIDCGATCSYTYPAGTSVTLTASPADGSLFAGWGSDCAASQAFTCTIAMSGTKFVSAFFVKGVTVSANSVGNGIATADGMSCNGTACSGLFFPQGYVEVTATPSAGAAFDYWENCPNNDPTLPANVCKAHGADFTGTVIAHFK